MIVQNRRYGAPTRTLECSVFQSLDIFIDISNTIQTLNRWGKLHPLPVLKFNYIMDQNCRKFKLHTRKYISI